ncbi:helix-turn-helix domain-containing protein [Sinorhizobium meliloti]|uniref:helix-turn-helix domain-containing protein n=1 Tax=Rhizobium meliloti TaxID=382 RepID=UPI003D660A15
MLALASIYVGGSRSDAARLGNVTLQIVRDWVMRFNGLGPQGLVNGKAPGQQLRLNDQQRATLAQAIERGSTPISTASFAVYAIWLSGFGNSFAFL